MMANSSRLPTSKFLLAGVDEKRERRDEDSGLPGIAVITPLQPLCLRHPPPPRTGDLDPIRKGQTPPQLHVSIEMEAWWR